MLPNHGEKIVNKIFLFFNYISFKTLVTTVMIAPLRIVSWNKCFIMSLNFNTYSKSHLRNEQSRCKVCPDF